MADSAASNRARLAPLLVLLVLSELGYLALLRMNLINGARPVLGFLALLGLLFLLYAAACRAARELRDNHRGALLVLAAGAVLFRLTLLPAGLPHDASPPELLDAARADLRGEDVNYERFLLYDSDLWRYLWDGHVAAHGINPYRHAPASSELDGLASGNAFSLEDGRAVWDDIRENVNHQAIPTVYPPLAQGTFRLAHAIAPGSVLAWKALMVAFDLLTVTLIALGLRALGLPLGWATLYAWNPLVIKVVAGSGHFDALVGTALAACALFVVRGARTSAALSLGFAVLAKLAPLALLPFLARRIGWRRCALTLAVVVSGYLPFLDAGPALFDGLGTFARQWRFNSGVFLLLKHLAASFSPNPELVARLASAVLIVVLLVWLARRDDGSQASFPAYAAAALGGLLVLSPAVMPWYLLWLLPLAALTPSRVWFRFSALVCLAFLIMIDTQERSWVLALEYSLLAMLIWRERQAILPERSSHASAALGRRGSFRWEGGAAALGN